MDTSRRIAELRGFMEERGIALSLVLNPDNLYYVSGFKALIYSRPIVLLVTADRTSLIVPGLEELHARAEAAVDELLVYYEHPEMAGRGKSHLDHLDSFLRVLSSRARVGVEMGFAPCGLVDHVRSFGMETLDVGQKIKEMRFIKDGAEIEMMMEAGHLVSLAVGESLAAMEPGITEMEIDSRGNAAVLKEVSSKHPRATLDLSGMSPSGVERTVMPHVFSNTRALRPGDIVIHSRQVALDGYRGECERTCFLGRPTADQARAFRVALEAQQAALDAIKPGVAMKEVDRAAREVMQGAGFGGYAIHRTGHGLGISAHEEPYLRFDEEMVLREGMVFSIEPGFYLPGLGGFRHSDTIIVTASGGRMTTDYPRDLESLIL